MFFNITHPKKKLRHQRLMLRQALFFEKGMRKKIRILLNIIVREAADAIESGEGNVDYIVDRKYIEFKKIYYSTYKRIGFVFSDMVFNSIAEVRHTLSPEKKGMGEEFWNAFSGFIQSHTATRVTKASKFTKQWIAKKINRGVQKGKSEVEIAKDLRKSGKFNKMRAKRIARTEVHMISNFATQKAVESIRVDMEKEWVSFIDERTRASHIPMNGVRVPNNEDFIVGATRMSYPGDPKGGAKNVINCRCVLMYFTIKK